MDDVHHHCSGVVATLVDTPRSKQNRNLDESIGTNSSFVGVCHLWYLPMCFTEIKNSIISTFEVRRCRASRTRLYRALDVPRWPLREEHPKISGKFVEISWDFFWCDVIWMILVVEIKRQVKRHSYLMFDLVHLLFASFCWGAVASQHCR